MHRRGCCAIWQFSRTQGSGPAVTDCVAPRRKFCIRAADIPHGAITSSMRNHLPRAALWLTFERGVPPLLADKSPGFSVISHEHVQNIEYFSRLFDLVARCLSFLSLSIGQLLTIH
jgi:hypothetical protein